jgi:C-terminal processing protease CtpA/Prc
VVLALVACNGADADATPTTEVSNGQFDPAEIVNDEGGTVNITGELTYSFPFFTDGVAEPLVILEDQAGFVDRDRGYLMPPESQTIGQITSDFFTSPFSYSISLPIEPQGGFRDVDNDGEEDDGVQVFAAAYWTNSFGDAFLEERDLSGGGWSSAYASTVVSELPETEGEYVGGKILVYAPDGQQGFPAGFGEDGLLFTEDDPIVGIPAGYTTVDLDSDPFTFDRSRHVTMNLVEPEGLSLDDFSALSYSEAFEEMWAMMSQEYSFTELKGIDWDALYDEFAPRFAAAEADDDADAYMLALRDYLWSIPDGHVGFSFDQSLQTLFQQETSGGLGMAIRDTSDGRVIVNFLTPAGPAEAAGIQLGAVILEINGEPIEDVVSASVPWSSPFSTEHTLRLQQLRYAVRFVLGESVDVTYQNPGGGQQTVTLETASEFDSFSASSFLAGVTGLELPVEFEIMDNGYGYVSIYSFIDNQLLTVQLWERMIQTMNDNGITGLVIDMRNNGGGFGFMADQMAAYFFDERLELGNTAVWDESIEDFYVNPDVVSLFYPPAEDLRFNGKVAVLVGPNCSSACEFFAWDMTLQDRAIIVGQYPTGGLAGAVKDFQMPNDVTVRFPIGRPFDTEGNIIIEGTGVVPDVVVPVNEETLFSAGDPVLEAAVVALDQPRGAGVTPESPPAMSASFDLIGELTAGTSLMQDLVREEYSEEETTSPGTLLYTVVLSESQNLIAGYFWCTTTQEILDDNWERMEFAFELNGQPIDPEDMQFDLVSSANGPCYVLSVLLSDWAYGEHSFVVDVNYTSALNDGFGDYAAGDYVSEFTIFVER